MSKKDDEKPKNRPQLDFKSHVILRHFSEVLERRKEFLDLARDS